MNDNGAYTPSYSSATAWPAEGDRVGIVTCLTCGSAVFLSMVADSFAIHNEWHREHGIGDYSVLEVE